MFLNIVYKYMIAGFCRVSLRTCMVLVFCSSSTYFVFCCKKVLVVKIQNQNPRNQKKKRKRKSKKRRKNRRRRRKRIKRTKRRKLLTKRKRRKKVLRVAREQEGLKLVEEQQLEENLSLLLFSKGNEAANLTYSRYYLLW